jgi:hypothetical protein
VHNVTNDALIHLVLDRLKKEYLEDFEDTQKDALEIAGAASEGIIGTFAEEKRKRSIFQYEMLDEIKESKAKTSMERAKKFVFELKKLLKSPH